jgi:hypothetical protein
MRSFAFLLLLASMLGAQQPAARPNWSAREVTARPLEQLTGRTLGQLNAGSSQLFPNSGIRVLEVSALLGSADPSRLALKIDEVFVKPSAEAPLAELRAVGIGGANGCSSYVITIYMRDSAIPVGIFVDPSGFVTTKDAAGNGYRLGRKTEQDPLEVTLLKNPTRLCLAFFVPESAGGKMTLHFGDATVPVQLP